MPEYKYYIKKIFQPAPNQVIIEASDKSGRPVFNYQPGQYAMISYRNRSSQMEDKHAFSLASSPTNPQSISFGIKIEGAFTHGLLNLQVGDELRVFGPYGNFCYQANKYPDAVMIAGGIGITPFFSALNYANDLKLSNKLALIYSARTKSGATFYPEIRSLQTRNSNLRTLFSFTEETGATEPNVINTRISAEQIKNFVGDISGKTFFICGPSLFMASMVANLLRLGVSRTQIKIEEFSMIPDKSWGARLKNISYALAFSALVAAIIFFSFIYEPAPKTAKKNYDANQLAMINSATYERMITIYDAKNKALIDLNQQILAAKSAAKSAATNSATTPVASSSSTPAATPVYRPATVYVPAPVYTPPKTSPTPTTGVSRAR